MSNSSSKSKSKRRSGTQSKQRNRTFKFASIAFITGKNVPFKLAQNTSGTGCISANNTGPSITSVNSVLIDPYTIGSRAALLAAEFAQWRVRSLTIEYDPDVTSSGVVNSQSGPTTTPSYGSRPFAMGFSKDPIYLPSTHPGVMEIGGVSLNTSKRGILKLPSSQWLWASTTTGYSTGSLIDNRTVSHGAFVASFVDASTTAAATYGRFVFTYALQFRYPVNANVIGATLNNNVSPERVTEEEEKKIDYADLSASYLLVKKNPKK
jgi:hypothetical protein